MSTTTTDRVVAAAPTATLLSSPTDRIKAIEARLDRIAAQAVTAPDAVTLRDAAKPTG